MPPRHKHRPPEIKNTETFAAYLCRKMGQAIQRFGWVGELPAIGVIISDYHCIVNVNLSKAYMGCSIEQSVIGVVTEEMVRRRIPPPFGMAVVTWTSQPVTRRRYQLAKDTKKLASR